MADDPQMKIRLPQALKSFVQWSAKNNNRSINSEVVARLLETISVTQYANFETFLSNNGMSISDIESIKPNDNFYKIESSVDERFKNAIKAALLEFIEEKGMDMPKLLLNKINKM